MRFDSVVVGAGTAGLVAGIRLAAAGRRVAVVARGVGATRLAPGTIDVLARREDDHRAVQSPIEALGQVPDGHPYARLGAAGVTAAAAWFRETVAELGYEGSLEENMLLPTAVGTVRPTAFAPAALAAGDVRRGGRVLLTGFAGLKDFYPRLAAANLRETAPGLSAVEAVELRVPLGDDGDPGPLGLARRFEDAAFRDAVVEQLRAALSPGTRVGFPAVLGLGEAPAVRRELEERLRAEVFEISTLPPSVPGLRLFDSLRASLRGAGGRLVVGGPVVGAESANGRVERLFVQAAGRLVAYDAATFVLATGGFQGRGLDLTDTGEVREPVLGLPVAGVPAGRPAFAPRYFDEQPLARAGVAVDGSLRPVGADRKPLFENVRVAGALLAGASPWREGSGEGISLASGFAAAEAILS